MICRNVSNERRAKSTGFRVQGSEFRVQSAGFRVQGSEFRVQILNQALRTRNQLPLPTLHPVPCTLNLKIKAEAGVAVGVFAGDVEEAEAHFVVATATPDYILGFASFAVDHWLIGS